MYVYSDYFRRFSAFDYSSDRQISFEGLGYSEKILRDNSRNSVFTMMLEFSQVSLCREYLVFTAYQDGLKYCVKYQSEDGAASAFQSVVAAARAGKTFLEL